MPEHPVADAKRFVLDNFAKRDAETLKRYWSESPMRFEPIITDGVDAAMARFN